MEKAAVIESATRAGKVINLSAESIKLTPLAVLKEMATQAPVTVPLSATATPAPGLPALKALSAEDEQARIRFGYTLEQWHAANPA